MALDRAGLLVFVGRGDILRDILDIARESWALHIALQELGRAALGTDGDLSGVDWEKVVGRMRDCRGQHSAAMSESVALIGGVMRTFRDGHNRPIVIDSINHLAGSQPGRAWQLPTGVDAMH